MKFIHNLFIFIFKIYKMLYLKDIVIIKITRQIALLYKFSEQQEKKTQYVYEIRKAYVNPRISLICV